MTRAAHLSSNGFDLAAQMKWTGGVNTSRRAAAAAAGMDFVQESCWMSGLVVRYSPSLSGVRALPQELVCVGGDAPTTNTGGDSEFFSCSSFFSK